MDDLRRLQERVGKLKGHFGQANDDLRLLETSAQKIETRATRIREVEFDGGDERMEPKLMPPRPPLAAAE
jgi:DNA recombination protein RmuC